LRASIDCRLKWLENSAEESKAHDNNSVSVHVQIAAVAANQSNENSRRHTATRRVNRCFTELWSYVLKMIEQSDDEVALNNSSAIIPPVNVSNAALSGTSKAFAIHSQSQLVSVTTTLSSSISNSSKTSIIIRCGLLFFVSLIGFIGNGTAVVTIRKTPKLRTKTYALLASLTMSDLLLGFTFYWVIAYLLFVYVFSTNPCSIVIVIAIMECPQRILPAITMMHLCLISAERYIAIVHPLRYEVWVTDSTIKAMIAFGWIFPIIPCSFYFSQIGLIDWQTCSIVASYLQTAAIDGSYILLITVVIVILNSRILMSALHQRAKFDSQVGFLLLMRRN
jgi:hypothetical protein